MKKGIVLIGLILLLSAGVFAVDSDGDGFDTVNGTIDCNDTDAGIRPLNAGTNYISSDAKLCSGTYSDVNVIINGSSVTFDCDSNSIRASGSGIGVLVEGSDVIVKNCKVEDYATGIRLEGDNNHVYNNRLENTNNTDDAGSGNSWSTTQSSSTNIIGGSNMGGNYYDDYQGGDADNDGIGESSYEIKSGVEDALPLTNNDISILIQNELITSNPSENGVIKFRVTITNDGDIPVENVSFVYHFDNNYLDYTGSNLSGSGSSSSSVSWADVQNLTVGQALEAVLDFEGQDQGSTKTELNVTIKDASGYQVEKGDDLSFTIAEGDIDRPVVLLESPADDAYILDNAVDFSWNVTDNKDDNMLCNLTVDGDVEKSNQAVENNSDKTKTIGLDTGNHTWHVLCWDDAGNVGYSENRTVYVNMADPAVENVSFNLDSGAVEKYVNESQTVYLTVDGKQYLFSLVEVFATSVQVSIPAVRSKIFMQENKEYLYDLDSDDVKDISIKLLDVKPQERAKFRFAPADTVEEVNDTNETEVLNETNTTLPFETSEEPEETEEGKVEIKLINTTISGQASADEATPEESQKKLDYIIGYLVQAKYHWPYLMIAGIVIIILVGGGAYAFGRQGIDAKGPGVPKEVLNYLAEEMRLGVYRGEISTKLLKAGWSKDEINRSLLFARMKNDLEEGMEAEFIRSDLLAQGWTSDQIREAFTYFNVKRNIENGQPHDKIQEALVGKGVPHSEINRAMLYNKVMDNNELTEEELFQLLRKKGWSKKEINKALFYAYVKNKLNRGLDLGKIEGELLRHGVDQGEVKSMLKGLNDEF